MDHPYQFGVPSGNPAEDEKRRHRASAFLEDVENALRRTHDAALEARPLLSTNHAREYLSVEVFLHVKR
jgi:hypothetical protein